MSSQSTRTTARPSTEDRYFWDTCERCYQLNAPIVVADDRDRAATLGAYRCRRCGYAWWTSYGR